MGVRWGVGVVAFVHYIVALGVYGDSQAQYRVLSGESSAFQVAPVCEINRPPGARPVFNPTTLELVAWWIPGQSAPSLLPGLTADRFPAGVTLPPDPDQIDPERSLLIRDAATMGEEPEGTCEATGPGQALGRWTLGCLLVRMGDAAHLSSAWLNAWQRDTHVNFRTVPGDASAVLSDILVRWTGAQGQLDPVRAPFRLIAIVNRIDRADLARGLAGDARFVFAPTERDGRPREDFTIIVEYDVPAGDRRALVDWAQRWKALDQHPLGTVAFRNALANITDEFSRRRPVRIRTNKLVGPSTWQLREFASRDGSVAANTVKDTPLLEVWPTDMERVREWITASSLEIRAGTAEVPMLFRNNPFLSGGALVQYGGYWQPFVDDDLRHLFALRTCNGCHYLETAVSGLETSLVRPQHVIPRRDGSTAGLSCFISGATTRDPRGGLHYFAEQLRRQTILADALGSVSVFPVPPGAAPKTPRFAH